MTMRFDGKVVIVTGAGRGLGRCEALLLAERGAKVVVNDLGVAIDGSQPSSAPADEVVAIIAAAGGTAIVDTSDVSTAQGVQALVELTVATYGALDIVVANAGTIVYNTPPTKLSMAQFDSQFDLMVSGVGLLVGAAWPHLIQAGAGRVILTSSAGGLFGSYDNAAYSAAKSAVVGMARSLSLDGEPHGIKVNAIFPLGSTRLFEGYIADEAFNRWFTENARPEAVAPLVGYLAHGDCEPTGRIFSTGLGHISEVFIGLTKGWHHHGHTVEDIRDHLGEIADRRYASVPATPMQSTQSMLSDAPIPAGY